MHILIGIALAAGNPWLWLKSAVHNDALLRAYERRALTAERRCWSIRIEALEEAARLHEQIDVSHGRDPMTVVIEYRDAIRALKEQPRG